MTLLLVPALALLLPRLPCPASSPSIPAPAAVTHGHTDHIGALPKLLEAFPDVTVVVHANEAPFLTGAAQYLPPGSPTLRLWRLTGLDWPESLQAGAVLPGPVGSGAARRGHCLSSLDLNHAKSCHKCWPGIQMVVFVSTASRLQATDNRLPTLHTSILCQLCSPLPPTAGACQPAAATGGGGRGPGRLGRSLCGVGCSSGAHPRPYSFHPQGFRRAVCG